jgi:exonuclease VII small subunit
MCAAELNGDRDRDSASELFGRGRALAAQIEASLTLAKEALAAAARASSRLHLERCVADLERAQMEVRSLDQELAHGHTPEGGEQVSSATNAAGDGADDAQVVPDDSRGRPGNWPAY